MSNEITLRPKFTSNQANFNQYIEDFEINFKTTKGSFIGTFNTWNITANLNTNNVTIPASIKLNLIINDISYKMPTFSLTPVIDEETEEWSEIKGYDKSVLFDTEFTLETTYPTTAGALAQAVCEDVGVEIADTNFINNNFIITRQMVDNKNTNREVIAMIAAIAAGNAFINSDDKLKIRSFIDTDIDIIEYFTSEKFVKIGPITGVNLAREPIKDYTILNDSELTEQYKKCIVKITNNLIVDDNREGAITGIYNALKGLEFYCKKIQTFEAIGIEPFSFIYAKQNKTLVDTICIKYPTLIDSFVSSTQFTEEESNLNIARGIEKRLINAEAQVDAINGIITLQAEEIEENSEKIATLELTTNGFKVTISNKADKTDIPSIINQSSEEIYMSSDRFSIQSTYFTLNKDGTMIATAGSIGGINIGSTGLFWSGIAATDGFGLWKTGTHVLGGNSIIFHAGANNSNIGNAGFRVFQNGSVYARNLTIESSDVNVGNAGAGNGLNISGTAPFIDFHANGNPDFTTRIIDYNSGLLIASDYDVSIVNRNNSFYRNIHLSRVFLDNANTMVWQNNNTILLSSPNGVRVTNAGNTALTSLYSSRTYYDNDSVFVWQSGYYMLLSSPNGVSVVNENNSQFRVIQASAFTQASSERYKENIINMTEEEANKVLDLRVVTFNYKKDSMMQGKNVGGLIAEETVELIPNVVSTAIVEEKEVPDSIDYSKLVPYLIKEVQVLNDKLIELRKELNN